MKILNLSLHLLPFLVNNVNLGPQPVTTNIEDNIREIQACYKDNYVLKQFIRVPGVKCTVNIQDYTERQPYQAILSRQAPG